MRKRLGKFVLDNLVSAIESGNLTEEEILNSIKIAELVSDNITSLITFIRQCILPLSFESQSARFLVLDMLCQLGSS
jgi:hypothetical protein